MTIHYSAVGKGLYNLRPPPSAVLDTFHIDLTAVGSDVRMLELSLQPTKYVRGNGKTVYTWDYKRLLFGRPIARASSVTVAARSWSKPRTVVLSWLAMARTWDGASSCIVSAMS